MSDEGYGNSSVNDRIERLERKVAELDALLKGITEEMLDMKAVVMKIKKDQRPAPVIQAVPPSVSRNKPIIQETLGSSKPAPEPVNPTPQKEKVTLKMQPDGTLKPVRDTGEDIIIASARDARFRKDSAEKPQSELIIAEDTEQPESK